MNFIFGVSQCFVIFVMDFKITILRREKMKTRIGQILEWELVQVNSLINFHFCVICAVHFRITDTC